MDVVAVVQDVVIRLGYQQVKKEQEDAVKAFVSGKDVFVCLPTGFGKSLCFHCLIFLMW